MNKSLQEVNFTNREHSEIVAFGSKGGSARTPKKSLAARLRGIQWAKSEETKQLAINKVLDLLLDPQLSQFELLRYAEEIKRGDLTNAQKIRLLEAVTKVHSAIHDQKSFQVVQAVNFQGGDLAEKMLREVFTENL